MSLITTSFTTSSDTIVGFDTTLPCVSPSKCLIGQGGEVVAFNSSHCEILSCGLCPKGMHNGTSVGSCVSCAKGSFNDEINQLECKLCAKGTYSDQVAQSDCKHCGTGNYCPDEGEKAVTKCPIGSYSDETTASACKVCPGGKYQVQMQQSSCDGICASGKYLPFVPEFSDHDAKDDCKGCPQGKYGPAPGASECSPCAAGKWSNKTDQTESTTCTSCPTGTVTARLGSTNETECKVCDPGTLSNNLRTDCVPCDTGKFLNATALSCQLCQRGFYSRSGATACTLCRPGTFAHAMGSSSCSLCPSGTFSPVSGATKASACKECPSGTFSAFAGADSESMCYRCAPGKYNPGKGGNASNACGDCPPGKVSRIFGASKCTHCPNGTSPNARNSDCNPCPAGNSLDPTSGNCTECPKGRFSPSSGNVICSPCKRGRYANYLQAVTCAPVPPGSVSLNCSVDFTACTAIRPCPAGFQCNDTTGVRRPFLCPRGKYSLPGSISCTQCPPGRYGSKPGVCGPCQAGTYSGRGGQLSCTACANGQYSTDIPRVACEKYKAVGIAPTITTLLSEHPYELYVEWLLPQVNSTRHGVRITLKNFGESSSLSGVNSTVNSHETSATIKTPEAVSRRVYVIDIQIIYGSSRLSPTATYNTEWKTTDACLGETFYLNASSPSVNDWRCALCPHGASCKGLITWSGVTAKFGYWRSIEKKFYKCLNPAACLGARNIEFADRYPATDQDHAESCNMHLGFANTSRLCATCATTYVRGASTGSCKQCQTPSAHLVELIVACVVACGFTLVFVEITVFKPRAFRLSDGVKKIALSYVQMAALATQVNAPWNQAFGGIFAVQAQVTSVGEAFLSIDCLLPHWSTWEVFRVKLALVLLFPLLVVPLAYLGVRGRLWKRTYDRTYFVSTMVLLLYLVYPTLVKKLTVLLTCTAEIDGTHYLQLDPSVPCWQGPHLLWAWSAGLTGMLVYAIGLPFAGYRALRGTEDFSDSKTRLQYGILYDGYRDEFWWWEMTVVGRKIAVILIGAFIKGTQQILTVLLCLAVLMFLTAFLQPFVNEQLLRLELMALTLCFFTFWVGSMLATDPSGGEGPAQNLAAWSVAALNVAGFGGLVYMFATSFWKEKGALLMIWLRARAPKMCCQWKKHRSRRESRMELLPASDYSMMNEDGE